MKQHPLSATISSSIAAIIYKSDIKGLSEKELKKTYNDVDETNLEYILRVLEYQGVLESHREYKNLGTMYYLTATARECYGTDTFKKMLDEVHVTVDVSIESDAEAINVLTTATICDSLLLTEYGWSGEDIDSSAFDRDENSVISRTIDEFESLIPLWLTRHIVYDISVTEYER